MVTPLIMPGADNGTVTFQKAAALSAPRSAAASIRLLSSLLIVVYKGSIINGRKSYVIPITVLRKG